MLEPWITSLALVSSLEVAGFALAQTPPPVEPGAADRTSLGTSLTVPMTPDGKPITTSTSFGQR